MTVLLVLFLLHGEASVFAGKVENVKQCIELETTVLDWLPKMINAKPEWYAAECTEIKPFATAL